jgi:hypothetical protein
VTTWIEAWNADPKPFQAELVFGVQMIASTRWRSSWGTVWGGLKAFTHWAWITAF